MGMGPIVWTCLALTVHQSPPQTYYLDSRKVALPIRREDQDRKDVQQFILLYSADEGRTWEQGASKRPGDAKPFEFRAPKDGTYWFLIQQIDRTGNPNPRDPNRVKPNIAIVVDTVKPQIKVSAERLPSGEIRAHWKAADSYPDLRSLRLEYHSGTHPESGWTPAGLPTTLEGEQKFACKDAGSEVRVRLRMKDQAGNEGEDVFVLSATVAAAAAAPSEGATIGLIPTTPSGPSGQPNRLTSQQIQRPIVEAPPGMPAPTPPVVEMGNPSPPPSGLPIPTGPMGQAPHLSPSMIGETPLQPANSAAVQIVRAREVRIDFTVGKVGPSGLGNANIYVTLDRGRSWKPMPGDVPISLTAGGDSHGPEVSGSVSVQLPAEGIIYGFIVAVKSKAGRAPQPPKPGDPPQALVEWDKTAPTGTLFKPQPDPSQPNTLFLGWEVKDRNLADKPITLEWAERTEGPWNPINEAPLPNSGQYPWRLSERLPPCVYLRLTMRDQAGNESRAQTDKPVLIDLSVPQTRITGIAPASR